VVFEVCFPDEERWEGFRKLPLVTSALDSVPDPVNGLLVYRGRGGAAGSGQPRKPKPAPSAAALEAEEPKKHRWIRLRRSSAPARGVGGTPDAAPDPQGDPEADPAL
jgi:hypothetical protein